MMKKILLAAALALLAIPAQATDADAELRALKEALAQRKIQLQLCRPDGSIVVISRDLAADRITYSCADGSTLTVKRSL
jgi:hypothetical protein